MAQSTIAESRYCKHIASLNSKLATKQARRDDDDYDIDFYTLDPVTSELLDNSKPSPREQLEFLVIHI